MDQPHSVQLMKKKAFKQIQHQSSFYLMIEHITERLDKGEIVNSKKVQFHSIDAVWWLSIGPYKSNKGFYVVTFYIETEDHVWKSNIWNCCLVGTINKNINVNKISTVSAHQTTASEYIKSAEIKLHDNMELQLTMTLSASIPLETGQKFFDAASQSRRIIAANKQILNEAKYPDFTFVVQGKEFKVHKCILAAASPIFDKMFSAPCKEACENKCHIESIDAHIFQHLINFIYTGVLPENFNEEDVSRKLFEAAHYYQIQDLQAACIQEECLKLSADNAIEMYRWAVLYKQEELLMEAWKIIRWDILEITQPMEPLPCDVITSLIAQKKGCESSLLEYRSQIRKFLQTISIWIKDENISISN